MLICRSSTWPRIDSCSDSDTTTNNEQDPRDST